MTSKIGLFFTILVCSLSINTAANSQVNTGLHKDSAKSLKNMVFTFEQREVCGPPVFSNSIANIFISIGLKYRMNIISGGSSPLVSHETLDYSVVTSASETMSRTSFIYAEVGPGGKLNYTNDLGDPVILQIDVKSVCWDLDRPKAIKLAKNGGADFSLLVNVLAEDMTDEINPDGQLGNQKSVRVQIDIVKVDVNSGNVVAAFSEEVRKMDFSVEGAVREGAKDLIEKGIKLILEK